MGFRAGRMIESPLVRNARRTPAGSHENVDAGDPGQHEYCPVIP
jgi:hypothetical protein